MAQNSGNNKKKGQSRPNAASVTLLIALLLVLAFLVWKNADPGAEPVMDDTSPPVNTGETTPTPEPDPGEPDETEEPEYLPEFEPYAVDSTQPSKLLRSTGIQVGGNIAESYSAADTEYIDFGLGADYTALEGVITFRGNNFRDAPAYGTANITSMELENVWHSSTGALSAPDGNAWTGNGWTGQPLIVKWPAETRRVMNMYDWAKQKDNLTEVIYASMDGNVYFLELETGEKTRDTLTLGYTFKGAGALDPRGYPLLYLGAGYNSNRGSSRAFVVSLIDGKVLFEYGNGDGFALRQWPMFDGSPLVDAETDQLIHPSENGIIYIVKLNTAYDKDAGTISINPTVVKWRYNGVRTGGNYWLGMEDSPIVFRGHMIVADNGGNLMCINLNTLQPVWVQDVLDDTNCTPILEFEGDHPYVYISTSFHAGWRASAGSTATIPIWKIDAVTGEIVWHTDYQCYTVPDSSGGVQGTIAVGKNQLEDLIFAPVSRTPGGSSGILSAMNKHTGEVVWEQETQMYPWSSPVAVYDSQGKGYVIMGTTGGFLYLFDGLTGEVLAHLDLGSNIEASPAVFNNMLVVGTRNTGIYGVKIK